MNDSISFATYNVLRETPSACTLCRQRPPVLYYETRVEEETREAKYTHGFCCASCAVELLGKLERAESLEWAEEQAALAEEDLLASEVSRVGN